MIFPSIFLALLPMIGAATPPPVDDEGERSTPAFAIEEGRLTIPGVGPDNPVIYDNDWWLDIIDAAYCAAEHKRGNLDLKGFIVTRDMWRDPPDLYSLESSVKDFNEFRDLALASGLDAVPEHTPGAADRLEKPEGGSIADTAFSRSPGSDLIVREAMASTPEQPLIIVVGGAPTTVATALLQEPAIADRILVLWLAIPQYNANDEWASHIVLRLAPVVHYNFQLRSGLTREMLASLPDNPITERLKKSELVYENGVGDGVLLAWLFDPSLITGAEPQELTGPTSYRPAEGPSYDFLHLPDGHKRADMIAQQMIDVLRDPAVWARDER